MSFVRLILGVALLTALLNGLVDPPRVLAESPSVTNAALKSTAEAESERDLVRRSCEVRKSNPRCALKPFALNALAQEFNSCRTQYEAAGCNRFLESYPGYAAHRRDCDSDDICASSNFMTLADGCKDAGIEFSRSVRGDCEKGVLEGVCIAGGLVKSSVLSILPYLQGPLFGGRSIASDVFTSVKQATDLGVHLSCLDREMQAKLACSLAVQSGLALVTRGAASARYAVMMQELRVLEMPRFRNGLSILKSASKGQTLSGVTGFTSKSLVRHTWRHATEFGIAETDTASFEKFAKAFALSKDSNALTFVGPRSGSTFKYNPKTNEFLVVNKNGSIETYFKPAVGTHAYSSNFEYFLRQFELY